MHLDRKSIELSILYFKGLSVKMSVDKNSARPFVITSDI